MRPIFSVSERGGPLGRGPQLTAASAPAITLQRELVEAITAKLSGVDADDAVWPTIPGAFSLTSSPAISPGSASKSRGMRAEPDDSPSKPRQNGGAAMLTSTTSPKNDDMPLRAYWEAVGRKYDQNILLDPQDLSHLPPHWAVISINVTEDKTTMFVSRHQANESPLVFSLPLDRQGKREGEAEEDLFTFDVGAAQLNAIIEESNETSRSAKTVETKEGRIAWWNKRYELDKRMKELVENMEFCWLGAFKVGPNTA